MDKILPLITQLRNLSDWSVTLQVDGGYNLRLPVLQPGKTRSIKLYRIQEFSGERWPHHWKIRVIVDKRFTGIELDPYDIMVNVRILFRQETSENGSGVLCVEGLHENRGSDYLLRHKYLGCMRNIFWDERPSKAIARSDSRLATKLRYLEGDGLHLSPFIDTTLLKKRQIASPVRTVILEKTSNPVHHGSQHKNDGINKINPNHVKPSEKPRINPLPPSPQAEMTTTGRRGGGSSDIQLDSSSDGESSSSSSSDDRANNRAGVERRRASENIGVQTMGHDHGVYMDSFVHTVLFMFAFTLVWSIPMLFL